MNSQRTFLPLRRTGSLITKETDGELLVYDLDNDRAHCLNPPAVAIWRRCNGNSTITELANELSLAAGALISEDVVQLAIKQFRSAKLLANSDELSSLSFHVSRRALIRKVGISVALLPVITSIGVPTASAATSCAGSCNPSQPNKGCAIGCTCTAIGNKCVNV
jgi:hypothetical protein